MIEIVKGRDNIKFIKLKDDVDEALNVIGSDPDENILWLEFRKLASDLVQNLLRHKNLKLVKRVHFSDSSDWIKHFSDFNHWTTLSFGFDGSNFDFRNQKSLMKLGGVWSRKWTGLDGCVSLQSYHVSGFNGEIEFIPNISDLLEIVLIQPKFTCLNGLESAFNLEDLEISLAKNLIDISQISSRNKKVKKLVFDGCKKISSYEAISKLEKLQQLSLLGSAAINSLEFTKTLSNLVFLNLNRTKLIDTSSINFVPKNAVVQGFKSK